MTTSGNRSPSARSRWRDGLFNTSVLALLVAAAPAQGASELTDLGTLPGHTTSTAKAISADGSVIVGYSFNGNNRYRGFRWMAASGMRDLGIPADYGSIVWDSTFSLGVSGDGNTVVGSALSGNYYQAVTRTDATGWTVLDMLNGSYYSEAYSANYDGSIVVGIARNGADSDHFTATRWDGKTPTALAMLNGGTRSAANDVSNDGSVIVGYAYDGTAANATTAVKWVNGTIQSLGMLNAGGLSNAKAVSGDGSVTVGAAEDGAANNLYTAVRWDNNGVHSLGRLAAGHASYANAVNHDGSAIVGRASDVSGAHGVRWTQADGLVTIEDWLRKNGVTVAQNMTAEATGISADGKIVVGKTTSETAFIARLESNGAAGGSGIIDTKQYSTTLLNKPTTQVGLNHANTVLHGAHGQPMRDLLAEGQQSFSITTDLGHDDNGRSHGGLGIGDLSYAAGFGHGMTGRIGFGGIHTEQTIATGGEFTANGFYLAPEASIPLGDGGAYVTLGGYYSYGRMDINRGYSNGGAMDYSKGATDSQTWAAKLRIDWLDAVTLGGTRFTPYAGLSYANTRMDGYTENGGGFPSRFNPLEEKATVARVGLDMVHELTPDIRLLGKVEAAYRFETETAPVSGQILGLSTFALAGQDIDQLWLRGGVGGEWDIGGGTASLMLNATTQGDDTDMWLRAGWKTEF